VALIGDEGGKWGTLGGEVLKYSKLEERLLGVWQLACVCGTWVANPRWDQARMEWVVALWCVLVVINRDLVVLSRGVCRRMSVVMITRKLSA
jgi:hypothetical protein